jgi:hypothetical protein
VDVVVEVDVEVVAATVVVGATVLVDGDSVVDTIVVDPTDVELTVEEVAAVGRVDEHPTRSATASGAR